VCATKGDRPASAWYGVGDSAAARGALARRHRSFEVSEPIDGFEVRAGQTFLQRAPKLRSLIAAVGTELEEEGKHPE